MALQLGKNPWILISLVFLETLFIFIPALISSKIENKAIKKILFEMGFQKNEDVIIKIIAGVSIGVLFFVIGDFIIIFFRDLIIKNLLGSGFVETGQEGTIDTSPVQPSLIQMVILIILQIVIIGPCEEAFFRGFLIKKAKSEVKVVYLIIISSSLFAFYHVPPFLVPLATTITFFGYYFTFGILLALIFIYFDYSLIPCLIAHSSFNIILLLI
ncbi:MAG: CPBP family intramembrane glutamic endopeptidase [Promethearchaeota archaeon]